MTAKNKCVECGKDGTIKSKPSRTLMSPNSPTFYLDFCSKECQSKYNKESYRYYAELDRNASDSECFVHDHWDGIMRVGKCKITGNEVHVEPLQPGNNSGQPKECYEHFVLNRRYQ